MKALFGVTAILFLSAGSAFAATTPDANECKLIKVEFKVNDHTIVGAHDIASAEASKDAVHFQLTQDAKKQLAAATEKNIGKKMDVLVDGKLVSRPVIQQKLASGEGEFGHFTPESAKSIVKRLECTNGWPEASKQ